MDKLIKDEEIVDNVVPFAKPQYKEEDPDWLWGLSVGTVFLMRQPPQRTPHGFITNPVLIEYHVMQKMEDPINKNRSVQLLNNLNSEIFQWVDSRDFSKEFRKHHVLMKGEDLYHGR